MKRSANFKVLIISIVLALLFLATSANVFVVSVFAYHLNSGENFGDTVRGIHKLSRTLPAKRGQITDINGVVLAQDNIAYTLFAIIDPNRKSSDGAPQYVNEVEQAAEKLAPILKISEAEVLSYLTQDAKQVEFGLAGKYLTLSEKEQILALGIPGLGFNEILTRYYPFGSLAADLIGFARYDETQDILEGQVGLEKLYNNTVKGINGYEEFRQDADGYALRQEKQLRSDAVSGNNIVLTLNKDIQETLDDTLAGLSHDADVQAKESWGAVVDLKTGKVVALSEYPTYNLNVGDIENYNLKGTQYVYEPGSTMKTFTVAAAIDQGVYPGEETFDSSPFYVGYENNKVVRIDEPITDTIRNAGNINYGQVSYDFGYEVSSNVMIAELLSKYLDPEIFHDYLYKLGFYKDVGFDKLEEGQTHDQWEWPLEKISAGFGQGSTVTMMQLLQAYTSIFNDGTILKPYVIDKIVNPDAQEIVYEGKTNVVGKPFKDTTTQHVRKLMRQVVTDGSAQRFNIPEIDVIGKTGTAEMVVDGRYSTSEYIFSSVLAFPYDDPQYMIYTAYQASYGHSINASAEHINTLTRKIVSTYGLSKKDGSTIVAPTEVSEIENYTNLETQVSIENLRKFGYTPIVMGEGTTVLDQYPSPKTQVLSNERVFIYTGSQNIKMPDMTGWSYKEVKAFAALANIPVALEGNGYVYEQNIAVGSVLSGNSTLEIKLK